MVRMHRIIAVLGLAVLPVPPAGAQQMSSSSWRPFVIAVVPVVGRNGAVGGVSVDTAGVLDRADVAATVRLRDARRRAVPAPAGDVSRRSPLRKISLRRLEAAIDEYRSAEKPLPGEMLFLAGLQRVHYVFAYPEGHDIILAGPAEGWRIDDSGEAVGVTNGWPVMHLDDLIVALRTAEAAAKGHGITCSIEPTAAGLKRYEQLMTLRPPAMSRGAISRLERTLGPSAIRITGVEPDTHFAHVLVTADFLMKRLAMNFEAAPVAGLPSYLELLRRSDSARPPPTLFRLWLAPEYDTVLRDPDGLAWELNGVGVKALAEDAWLTRVGAAVPPGPAHPAAQEWAETFTEKYSAVAARLPAFGRLAGCFDLAVAAAIMLKDDLRRRTGCGLKPLYEAKAIDVQRYPAPRETPSRATWVENGDSYLVSLSGGVDLDSWRVVKAARPSATLATVRAKWAAAPAAGWWWD